MNVPAPHGLVLLLLCGALGIVMISDFRTRKIPNKLLAGIAVGGLGHAIALGGPWAGVASLVGAAIGTALLLWQFRRGIMGAGDVKLLGALGSWAGAAGAIYIFVLGSVLGGLLAIVSLVRLSRRERHEVGRNLAGFAQNGDLALPAPANLARGRGIPYGIALAAAGAAVFVLGGVGR